MVSICQHVVCDFLKFLAFFYAGKKNISFLLLYALYLHIAIAAFAPGAIQITFGISSIVD
jgi:hypothetical protein